MRMRSLIENHGEGLSASERRLAQVVLDRPQQAAMATAAQLAAEVGVHESTVVRMAQKLGFSGYRAFRLSLRQDVLDLVGSADRLRRRLGRAHSLSDLVVEEAAALQELVHTVAQRDIERAAKALIQSRRIYLFARGHGTALVEFMDRRLRRSGYDTVDLRADGRDLAEKVLTLGSEDVLLAFALRDVPRGLLPLLGQCRQAGTTSILIGDTVAAMVWPKPDVLLWARRGVQGELLTLLVPMAICYGLVLTLAELDGEKVFASLDRVVGLVHRYERSG